MNMISTRTRLISWMVVLAILLPLSGAGAARDVLTGVTTGQMKVTGQNLPGAKEKAVTLALERAVQNAFASLVSRQVFASNLEFLYDRLLPGASDYVVTFRVLDSLEHKGQVLVGVESKIDLARMRKQLEEARILRAGKDKPVVLFLIAEQTPADLLPKYWWGKNPEPYTSLTHTIINEQMQQRNILLAFSGTPYPDPGYYTIEFSGIYDVKPALDLARAMKADMVVMGKAAATESYNRMGDARTFEAEIKLKGWDVASGKVVVQTTATATATSHIESEGAVQSLSQAAGEAAQDLGSQIETYWSQNLRKENRFDVAVEGENFLPRFIALKRRFKDIRDIENMQPKEIGAASAVLEVLYKGSPQQFANAVLLKTFDGFGLEIAEVTPELVRIRFVAQQTDAFLEEETLQTPPVENPAE